MALWTSSQISTELFNEIDKIYFETYNWVESK